jgi:hypothetical protein
MLSLLKYLNKNTNTEFTKKHVLKFIFAIRPLDVLLILLISFKLLKTWYT